MILKSFKDLWKIIFFSNFEGCSLKFELATPFSIYNFFTACLQLSSILFGVINPIPTEGGPFGPEQPKTVWHFHSFMTGVTKIHDFVCFSICLVPVKLFWKKKLWNFEKLKKTILTILTPKGPPFGKKSKK